MKKICVILMALAMLLSVSALAEVQGEIVDGGYVIHVPDANGDLGWLASDMSQDDTVVRLESAGLEGDEYVARYAPTGDGDVCVGVRHFTGIACDEAFTWDLSVRDGAVVEVTGGSHTASPDPAEADPYLIGKWETANGMTALEIEKNPSGSAWDVEITGAQSHGGYVFKTTVYYDCELDSFVYDKGKFWQVPITDSETPPELGEANVAGTSGSFRFVGAPENLSLSWYDSESPDQTVEFFREGAVVVDYADSELYTVEDLDAAVDLIRKQISEWEGCTLLRVRYNGDDDNTEEKLAWLNGHDSAQGKQFTECACFLSDFRTPADTGNLSLEPDTEYSDYNWWFAREKGGEWVLVDLGY